MLYKDTVHGERGSAETSILYNKLQCPGSNVGTPTSQREKSDTKYLFRSFRSFYILVHAEERIQRSGEIGVKRPSRRQNADPVPSAHTNATSFDNLTRRYRGFKSA